MLAKGRGSGVGLMIREWLIEKLVERRDAGDY
jgi:hypothetical protein